VVKRAETKIKKKIKGWADKHWFDNQCTDERKFAREVLPSFKKTNDAFGRIK
jgi:hypothetical protein